MAEQRGIVNGEGGVRLNIRTLIFILAGFFAIGGTWASLQITKADRGEVSAVADSTKSLSGRVAMMDTLIKRDLRDINRNLDKIGKKLGIE